MIKFKKSKLSSLLFILILISLTVTAFSPVKGKPVSRERRIRCTELGDNLHLITAENITVKVASEIIPHFHFWYTADNSTVYHVKFVSLMEFIDRNGDSAFQYNELVKASDLPINERRLFHTPIFAFASAATGWNFSGFYNITSDENIVGLGFNYTLSGVESSMPAYRDLQIKLVCKIYLNNTVLSVTDDNQTIYYNMTGGAELKVDIILQRWPWLTNRSMLALRWDISWEGESRVGEGRSVMVSGHRARLSENMTFERHVTSSVGVNEVSVIFRGERTNRTYAYFDSLKVVRIRNSTHERLANATFSYRTDGNALRFYVCYPYFGDNELVHDPTMGVQPASLMNLPVPVPDIPAVPNNTVAYNLSRVIPLGLIRNVPANMPTLLLFDNLILMVNSSVGVMMNLTIDPAITLTHYIFLNLEVNEPIELRFSLNRRLPPDITQLDNDVDICFSLEVNTTISLNATLQFYVDEARLEAELGRDINVTRLAWAYWNGSKWVTVESWIDDYGYLTAEVSHLSTWSIVEVKPLRIFATLSPEDVIVGDLVTVTVNLEDDQGNPIIGAYVRTVLGEIVIDLSDQGGGVYSGSINTEGLEEGSYEVVVMAEKDGYLPAKSSRTLSIRESAETPWMLYLGVIAVIIVIVVAVVIVYRARLQA